MKYKTLIFIILSAFILNSCEEFLMEEPLDTMSPENFYKTEADAIAAVNGIYDVLRFIYRTFIMRMEEIPSDNVYPGFTANPEYHRMNAYTFDPENPEFKETWKRLYWGVTRANAVLEYVPNIEMDEELKNRLLGEARFMRAFHYFHLVKFWGDVPLVLEVYKSLEGLDVPRNPASEVYRQIIEDLEFAEEHLPWNYNSLPPQNNYGRATKGAAKALLAKVYLTRGCMENLAIASDFEKAAGKALEVIESNEYQLEEEYEDIFNVNNKYNKEIIFAWWALGGTHAEGSEYTRSLLPRTFSDKLINGQGRSFFLPEDNTWDCYTIGDIRRDVNILYGEPGYKINHVVYYGDTLWLDNNNDTIDIKVEKLHIWKYKDFNAASTADDNINFPILRYADVILMYAEALNYINNGPTQEACDYINMIRHRAKNKALDEDGLPVYWFALPDYSPDQFVNADEFLEAIMKERRWELMFEGHRRSDLIRWGKLIDIISATGVENIQDYHILYPIPQRELDANPNLIQNPGY